MKRLAVLAMPFFMMSSVSAAEIRSIITDSVQLTVNGPAVQSTRIGHSMSISGDNVNTTDGTTSGVVGNAFSLSNDGFTAATSVITATQSTEGDAFSFSASYTQGDALVTSQTANDSTSGTFSGANLYGDSITNTGGTAGNLAGTLSATGVPTVTAGGAGTSAVAQRSIELSVFQ